jgi:hypothetical protein
MVRTKYHFVFARMYICLNKQNKYTAAIGLDREEAAKVVQVKQSSVRENRLSRNWRGRIAERDKVAANGRGGAGLRAPTSAARPDSN